MAPQARPHTAQDISAIAARIDVIVGRLRTIEVMLRSRKDGDPETLDMVVDKADDRITYLDDWSKARLDRLEKLMRDAAKARDKAGRKK